MYRPGSRLLVLALAVLSVAGGLSAAAVGSPAGTDAVAQQTTPTANNTTVQHERPSAVSEAGDDQRVSQWLAQRLQSRLQGSAVNISQGQYESAREFVGGGFDSRLDQYVDVAGDTRGDYDDRAAESFNDTQSDQAEFANTSRSYEETYDEYQDAQARGNTTRARATARELETLSDRLVTLNESLQRDYGRLTNRTGVPTETTSTAIATTTREVSATQATVRSETFVETTLTANTNDTSVAFDDPIAVRGRIRAGNNTTLANETVSVAVGNRTYLTRTDGDGRFEVSYRPVALGVDATNATVRYRPGRTTQYLGAATSVPVNVTQVTPTLDLTATSDTVGYGDTIATRATATVDGRPVPSLPLALTVGSATTGNVTTAAGETTLSGRLPASVPTGNRTLRVDHARTGRAVAPAATTTPVTVTPTATNLTVTAAVRNDSVVIRGRLRTDSGTPVDGQPVTVGVGGTNRTVVTNATGWYRLSPPNLSADGPNATVDVRARFAGSGTNLDASRARTTLDLSEPPPPTDTGAPLVWLLVGAVGAITVAGVVAVSRYAGSDPERAAPADPEPTATAAAPTAPAEGFLTDARAALDDGRYDRSIGAAYASVRARLTAEHGLSNDLTHREFLAAVEAQVGPLPEFATLAAAYERATFEGAADAPTAEEALAAATALSDADRAER